MTVDRKIQTYLLPLWDNTSAWSDLWKKTKIEKSTQEFPIFYKEHIVSRNYRKSTLTTLSELRKRWLWSLRSKKKDQNTENPRKIFIFFKKFEIWCVSCSNPCSQLFLSSENDGFEVWGLKKTKIREIHVRFSIFSKIRIRLSQLPKSLLSTLSELRERSNQS